MSDKTGWITGQVQCTYCGKEWTAVAPESVETMLECPRCHLDSGQFIKRLIVLKTEPENKNDSNAIVINSFADLWKLLKEIYIVLTRIGR